MMKRILLSIGTVCMSIAGFAQGEWATTITYNMAIPLGNTADFIDEGSFRGTMLACDYYLEDQWSLGFVIGIQTFYDELGKSTYERGTLTATGEQFRYLNSVPMLLTGKYHFNPFAVVTPHVGLGAGMYNMIQTVELGGLPLEYRNWQIGLMPEVGIGIELSPSTDFFLSANYNTYFKSKDIDAQSYLAFQVGLRFIP